MLGACWVHVDTEIFFTFFLKTPRNDAWSKDQHQVSKLFDFFPKKCMLLTCSSTCTQHALNMQCMLLKINMYLKCSTTCTQHAVNMQCMFLNINMHQKCSTTCTQHAPTFTKHAVHVTLSLPFVHDSVQLFTSLIWVFPHECRPDTFCVPSKIFRSF